MSEEELRKERVPFLVIDTLFRCMEAVAKMVVENDDVLRGYPAVLNTIVISLGLAESESGPAEYYHCLFRGSGRYVEVFGCRSKQPDPDDCGEFEHLVGHDTRWFGEGTHQLREMLEGGLCGMIISFKSEQFRIKSEDFKPSREKGTRHRLITRGNIRLLPETEYQAELGAFREACAAR